MSDSPKPYFDPIKLRCKRGHEWEDWTPQHVSVRVLTAAWRGYRCPKCGAKRGICIVLVPAETVAT